MMQTNGYQFNLVEAGDTFSPAPLNENMEKVEAALGVGGQTCRVAWGSYVGNGEHGAAKPTSVTLDFYPLVMFVTAVDGSMHALMIRGAAQTDSPSNSSYSPLILWDGNTVSWYSKSYAASQMNVSGAEYNWCAIGIPSVGA